MNPEKLNYIKEVFQQALHTPSSERHKFVIDKCGDDSETRQEVLSLLSSLTRSTDFLEAPLRLNGDSRIVFRDPLIGTQIGRYLIEKEAGVGGMGVVYEGRRNDKEFEQRVAVKVLRYGITSDYLLKRFQIERQTLAHLQHQNIARLLDGGRTQTGLPYLVMEFIEGLPITEYCRNNDLTVAEKLDLFTGICKAVQYAHQNLVVHRDLKPGNILVTADGIPKLLDFGIAKLLDEDIADQEATIAHTGVWHLTPDYASPEQINGGTITTSADIYSLGVLLYQILTGVQPYKTSGNSPASISRSITEDKIIKPSEKLKQMESRLYKYLQGDLDNIILKAMRTDPARRYASVEQFSEDIQRHLSGLPVLARKDTASYRISKFIQRHKVGFVTSAAFTLFLIVSLFAIAWQIKRADKERDNAKTESAITQKVNDFLQEMLSSPDPTELGRDIKVYDVLKKASENLGNSFSGHPEVEAAIRKTIGKTLTNLGEFDSARPHLFKSLELNKNVYGINDYHTAESMHELALYIDWTGDFVTSDSLYLVSIGIFRNDPDSPPRSFASCLNDYATLKQEQEKYQESLDLLNEAYKIYVRNFGDKDRDVASVSNNLGLTYESLGNLKEAEKYYKKSLDVYLKLYGPDRLEISTLYNNLAYIYIDENKQDVAEEYFQKSLALKKKALGENHSLVGLAYMNLGALQTTLKKYSVSESNLLAALDNFRRTLNGSHVWMGIAYYWYSKILIEKGDYTGAENSIKKALKIYKLNYKDGHSNIISANAEMGIVKFYEKDYKTAEVLLEIGYKEFCRIKGTGNPNTLRVLDYLVKLYRVTDNSKKFDYYNQILQKSGG